MKEEIRDYTELTAACTILGLLPVNGMPGYYQMPSMTGWIDLSDLSPSMDTLPKAIIKRLWERMEMFRIDLVEYEAQID